MNSEDLLNKAQTYGIEYGMILIKAIAVWIIGVWILKLLMRAFDKMLSLSKIDDTLRPS